MISRSGLPLSGTFSGRVFSRPENCIYTRSFFRKLRFRFRATFGFLDEKQKLVDDRKEWIIFLALCMGTRIWSAIYYIEDPDSLRFALGVIDFDVGRMQPHFPAYPVFCFFAKLIYEFTGRYALAFAVLGGLSTWVIIYFSMLLAQTRITEPLGLALAFVLFFNPLLWLMSNRYMSDVMGVAVALASCYFATREATRALDVGYFLAGVMLGVRLSIAPLLIPVVGWGLWGARDRLRLLGAGTAGVLIWLLPLIAITGWEELVVAGKAQTQGHFGDFGGTLTTHSDYVLRALKTIQGLWADGFGLYWPDRHWLTLCSAITLVVMLAANWRALGTPGWAVTLCWGGVLYLIWAYLFQNVIHKSRHLLPLVPLLAFIPASAMAQMIMSGRKPIQLTVVCFALCYSGVTLHLVSQHKQPSAIAQVYRYLRSNGEENLHIVSVPLVKYYLSSQGLKATYITIESVDDLRRIETVNESAQLVAIGSPVLNRTLRSQQTFYHNPYVNRMWPELDVYEY